MLRKNIGDVFIGGLPFLLLGALVMIPLEHFGGGYQKEAQAIFMESLAPRTIMIVFVFATMLASLVMFCAGVHNRNAKWNDLLYKYFVFRLTGFGKSFVSAAIGMLLGLSLAALINGSFGVALGVLFTVLIFAGYWVIFSGIDYVAVNGFGGDIGKTKSRVILVIAFLGAPILYTVAHEPVSDCICEESANKNHGADALMHAAHGDVRRLHSEDA